LYLAESSPPSPVLLLPPMRFMAMAMDSWVSLLMEPKDMAPVLKRLQMESTDSTSSRGIGLELFLNRMTERSVDLYCSFSLTSLEYSRNIP
jgi:hypothetical protein